jgi:hypothetical protein
MSNNNEQTLLLQGELQFVKEVLENYKKTSHSLLEDSHIKQAQLKFVQTQISQLNSAIQERDKVLSEAVSNLESLKKENENQKIRLGEFEDLVKEQNELIEYKKTREVNNENMSVEWTKERESLKNEISKLIHEKEAIGNKVIAFRDLSDLKEQEKEKFKNSLENEKNVNKVLNEELFKINEKNKKLIKEQSVLLAQLDASKNELAERIVKDVISPKKVKAKKKYFWDSKDNSKNTNNDAGDF